MARAAAEELTDEVLMLRFQAGDRAAFPVLVKRHKTAFYNYTLRLVRVPATAEELVQDVFVKVVHKAAEFRHDARFVAWAYAIAHNVCVDHLRKMALRRHPSLDQVPSGDSDGPTLGEQTADRHPSSSAERVAIGAEMGARITRAVEALPAEQREVFLLRQLGDLSFNEIAEVTGVTAPTAKSRMRYALERLQEALSEYEDYARALR